MSGELYALLAALAYGFAGVAITKGRATARGDNGLFLSVIATALLSGLIWVLWGTVSVRAMSADSLRPMALFALAGLMATVFGRLFMFKATERTGPVIAGLLRRLTPVFGLLLGYLFLSEWPGEVTLAGAAIVTGAVLVYLRPASLNEASFSRIGLAFGVGSAAAYAFAYTLRSAALESLPDAAFGTFVGALVGGFCILAAALLRQGQAPLRTLLVDRGRWHLLTAAALSSGQFLQFLALKTASVVTVATLGTLEVFFAAMILRWMTGARPANLWRLVTAGSAALVGTAIMLA
ncbi:DMT family transporter [Sulfitobacter sp. S0837]|uniref:DMT family transporter n=1 Tax=Sulfitobacter maritimus TaxID=2741719 RepID=UPI001581811B|nr:DMT family transporter [Sulfitobacter maritimus]NUH63891.1 DMT family transporter [Sulfitobacter maritimus]